MWKRIILIILLAMLLFATPVLAADSVDITVTAQGIVSGGITDFTIIYVTDTRLDLTWTLGDNISKIMIRAKYGEYPADITADNETPSDGYLVYYGSGNSTSDTSMNLDQNPGPIYYRAWAQRVDGGWVTTPSEGWKESKVMTLLAIIGVATVLSFIGVKYTQMRLIAGMAWWFVAVYWVYSPPSAIAKGSPPDVFAIVLFIAAGAIMLFWPFFSSRVNGVESGSGLRVSIDRLLGRQERAPRVSPNQARYNRNAAYRDRVNRALGR